MTLRELALMAKGRASHDWDQSALLICLIHNANAGKGTRKLKVEDVHPYLEKKHGGTRITKANVQDLKALATK